MSTRFPLVNAALLAAVIALALVAWLKPGARATGHALSALKPADAQRITLAIAGSREIELARSPAGWRLQAPLQARADDTQVQRILDLLEATAADRYPPAGLARFDLNEPATRVTINGQAFGFGAINEMSREQYVLTQDAVFLVPMRYGAALPKNALQLVSLQLFAPSEAPSAFEMPDFKVVRQNGEWRVSGPRAASAGEVERWAEEWRLATAISIQPASGRKPQSTLSVTLADDARLTIAILQREPELVVARSDGAIEYVLGAAAARRLLNPAAAAPR